MDKEHDCLSWANIVCHWQRKMNFANSNGPSTRLEHPVRTAVLQQCCWPCFPLLLANHSAFRKCCQHWSCQNQLCVTEFFPFSVTLVVIKCLFLTGKNMWSMNWTCWSGCWFMGQVSICYRQNFKSLIKKPCWFKDLTRNVRIMNYLQMIIQIISWWFISPSFIKLPF